MMAGMRLISFPKVEPLQQSQIPLIKPFTTQLVGVVPKAPAAAYKSPFPV